MIDVSKDQKIIKKLKFVKKIKICKKNYKKLLTKWYLFDIIIHALRRKWQFYKENVSSEKYSRGRRGAPAKGIGRVTGARVRIPLSPFKIFKIKFKKIKKVVDKRK